MQSCHICQGALETLHAEVSEPETLEKFSLSVCRECGFGQTFPQPENLALYYAEYHGKRHGFTADFCARRRVRWLEKSFDSRNAAKRVLDVGCGDGTFLDTAIARGWTGAGTELDAKKFQDLDVYEDLAAVKARFGAGFFDAVTMWHTLEHFRNPREVLLEAFELLAPGGVLFVAVPDAGGWQARIFGRFWLHLDVSRHLFHFNFDSLEMLLKQCGFAVKTRRHQEFEYDLLGWSQSGLNSIFTTPNVFFKTLSGRRTSVNRKESAANLALGLVFSAFALPLVLLGTLSKKGGTLVICASKVDNR